MNILNKFFEYNGFKDTVDFCNSALHPKQLPQTSFIALIFSGLAYSCEHALGVSPYTIIGMILLFMMELITGVYASKRAGKKFDSHLFPKGWIKFFFYITMICASYLFSKHMEIKPIFGVELNYWIFIHYTFINFTLLNLFISNLENAMRLGFGEYVPLIKKVSTFFNIDTKPKTNN